MGDIVDLIDPPTDFTDTAVVFMSAGNLRKAKAEIARLRAEVEKLKAALQDDPTLEQVDDACMSFRHDYGLMSKVDRSALKWNATEWLRAWQKAFARVAIGDTP